MKDHYFEESEVEPGLSGKKKAAASLLFSNIVDTVKRKENKIVNYNMQQICMADEGK